MNYKAYFRFGNKITNINFVDFLHNLFPDISKAQIKRSLKQRARVQIIYYPERKEDL